MGRLDPEVILKQIRAAAQDAARRRAAGQLQTKPLHACQFVRNPRIVFAVEWLNPEPEALDDLLR